jgi:bacterioferritin
MRGDATVIEYLNKALRHELSAINQYWLHHRLLENWGYLTLAKKWREESKEAVTHYPPPRHIEFCNDPA